MVCSIKGCENVIKILEYLTAIKPLMIKNLNYSISPLIITQYSPFFKMHLVY